MDVIGTSSWDLVYWLYDRFDSVQIGPVFGYACAMEIAHLKVSVVKPRTVSATPLEPVWGTEGAISRKDRALDIGARPVEIEPLRICHRGGEIGVNRPALIVLALVGARLSARGIRHASFWGSSGPVGGIDRREGSEIGVSHGTRFGLLIGVSVCCGAIGPV